MDEVAKEYLEYQEESTAVRLVCETRCGGMLNIASVLSEYFLKYFPNSRLLLEEYGLCLYSAQEHEKAYDVYDRILCMRGLTEGQAKAVMFNQHFCVEHIFERYVSYDEDRVREITRRVCNEEEGRVTLTITSCKRLDLFKKTVNSFINCCTDVHIISRWVCVDDNSDEQDRREMKKLYPFFDFYWKTPQEKGHPQSMNILRSKVDTPYIFHLEDDWLFISRRDYLSDALEVLGEDGRVKQCLINRGYAERQNDIDIVGGAYKVASSGLRYFVHEMPSNAEEKAAWALKHGTNVKHCNYWPHYSFRPSLFSARVWKELGEFDEGVSHFERDYSIRYARRGWQSAFLEGVYCLHTGRLTSERNDATKLNAYVLNDEAQFDGKEEQAKVKTRGHSDLPLSPLPSDGKMRTVVVNLNRRPDRWGEFLMKAAGPLAFMKCERYEAVDGTELKSTAQLQRIFDGNDYNMRKGIVGCAMSHIKLYVEMLESDAEVYCILEDDLDFVPDFELKFRQVYSKASLFDWDMIYLGHHLFEEQVTDESYDKEKVPRIEKWDRAMSLGRSMGGTGGYLISRQGAQKLLKFINGGGMTNGIDTVQQKAADVMSIFYVTPHLIYSECYRGSNNTDTDIQRNYDSLSVGLLERKEYELGLYDFVELCESREDMRVRANDEDRRLACCYEDADQGVIRELSRMSVHPSYTLDDKVVFIVPDGNPERYFDRLKKGGKYDITDALVTN